MSDIKGRPAKVIISGFLAATAFAGAASAQEKLERASVGENQFICITDKETKIHCMPEADFNKVIAPYGQLKVEIAVPERKDITIIVPRITVGAPTR
jgi:hypothetical protein